MMTGTKIWRTAPAVLFIAMLGASIGACGNDDVAIYSCQTGASCAPGYACVQNYCSTSCSIGCAAGYTCGGDGVSCILAEANDSGQRRGCTIDADCDGHVCTPAGECSGDCTDGCALGFECGANAACVSTREATPCADADCAPYVCATTSECYTGCSDGSECEDGAQCNRVDGASSCEASTAQNPYMWIAVVSAASGPLAIGNSNPGPDIDHISVSSGSAELGVAAVVGGEDGFWSDDGNTRPIATHANAVLSQDTQRDDYCDFDLGDGDGSGLGYLCIGGTGGFVVAEAARELITGDVVTVYEIDPEYCPNAATERPDAYEVYVTNEPSLAAQGSAFEIRSDWCLLGAVGGNGGVGRFVFDSGRCIQ